MLVFIFLLLVFKNLCILIHKSLVFSGLPVSCCCCCFCIASQVFLGSYFCKTVPLHFNMRLTMKLYTYLLLCFVTPVFIYILKNNLKIKAEIDPPPPPIVKCWMWEIQSNDHRFISFSDLSVKMTHSISWYWYIGINFTFLAVKVLSGWLPFFKKKKLS